MRRGWTTWALQFFALATNPLFASAQTPPVQPPPPSPTPVSPVPEPAGADRTQFWAGAIQQQDPSAAPIAVLLTFVFDPKSSSWTGTLDVPPAPGLPGAIGLPFARATIADTELEAVVDNGQQGQNVFVLRRQPGASSTSDGRFVVNGVEGFSFSARRIGAAEAGAFTVQRPQMPRPPFPYRELAVSFANPTDQNTIAGTLTVPGDDKALGPFPAVILVNDFGPHDRDRTDSLHKLYLVLADRLTREGIAVLRTDDRGAGASTGDYNGTTFSNLIDDVRAAIAGLSQQQGIDASRIGLVALGEGAPVAAAAAANNPVKYLAFLAPQALSGYETLAVQTRRQLEAQGEDEAFVNERTEARRNMLRLIGSGADEPACLKAITDAINGDIAAQRGEWSGVLPSQVQATAEQAFMTLTLPRFRPWLGGNPAAIFSKVTIPVLIVAGSRDLVMPSQDHIPALQTALDVAKPLPGAVTVHVMPGLNHGLQPAGTGMPDETIQIRTTIAPEALDLIVPWIKARAGVSK